MTSYPSACANTTRARTSGECAVWKQGRGLSGKEHDTRLASAQVRDAGHRDPAVAGVADVVVFAGVDLGSCVKNACALGV